MHITGNKLELLAAEKGLSFTKLSELSGISRQSISAIKNRGTCRTENACKLARALGVNVEELLEVK